MTTPDPSFSKEASSRSRWSRWAPWGLVLVGLTYFFRALFFDQVFFFRDLQNFFLPERGILAQLVRSGELPLLDPYLHGGVPLLGNIGYTALYPSALLYLWLPATRALAWELVAHVVLASLAAYALARTLRFSVLASCLVGLSFAYCGYSLSQLNLFVRLLALPYLPLILLSVHRWVHGGRRRWAVLAIGAGALQLLAGAPDVVGVTWGTALLWVLIARDDRGARRRAWLSICLPIAVLLVSALQVLPLMELTRDSTRGEGWSDSSLTSWSVAKRRLPELVLADFNGRTDLRGRDAYWGEHLIGEDRPYVLSLYFGALLMVLAAMGVGADSRLSRRVRLLLAGLALVSVVLALGRHLFGFEFLLRGFPILRIFRYPVKFIGGAILPLALLAGAGIDSLRSGNRCSRLALAAGMTAAFFLGWTALMVLLPEPFAELWAKYFVSDNPSILDGIRASAARTGLVLAAAALVALAASRQRRAWQIPAITALVVVDLLTAGRPLNPAVPDSWFDEPVIVEKIRAHIGEGRIYRQSLLPGLQLELAVGETLLADRWYLETLYAYGAAGYRLPTIYHMDFDGLAPRALRDLTKAVGGRDWASRLAMLRSAGVTVVLAQESIEHPDLRLVEEVVDPTGIPLRLYVLEKSLDRVRFSQHWSPARDAEASLEQVLAASFDPGNAVVVEDDRPGGMHGDCSPARLEAIETDISRGQWQVVTDCPGYIIWSSTHLPGWKVWVDDVESPVVRADHAFSAVFVEAGEHRIDRIYRPTSVVIGATLSFFSILALLWFWRAEPRRILTPRG